MLRFVFFGQHFVKITQQNKITYAIYMDFIRFLEKQNILIKEIYGVIDSTAMDKFKESRHGSMIVT